MALRAVVLDASTLEAREWEATVDDAEVVLAVGWDAEWQVLTRGRGLTIYALAESLVERASFPDANADRAWFSRERGGFVAVHDELLRIWLLSGGRAEPHDIDLPEDPAPEDTTFGRGYSSTTGDIVMIDAGEVRYLIDSRAWSAQQLPDEVSVFDAIPNDSEIVVGAVVGHESSNPELVLSWLRREDLGLIASWRTPLRTSQHATLLNVLGAEEQEAVFFVDDFDGVGEQTLRVGTVSSPGDIEGGTRAISNEIDYEGPRPSVWKIDESTSAAAYWRGQLHLLTWSCR